MGEILGCWLYVGVDVGVVGPMDPMTRPNKRNDNNTTILMLFIPIFNVQSCLKFLKVPQHLLFDFTID